MTPGRSDATCRYPQFAPSTAYKHGCRCDQCREWARLSRMAWRRSRGVMPAKRGRTHGTISCYIAGCKCPLCREANRAKRAAQRARRAWSET